MNGAQHYHEAELLLDIAAEQNVVRAAATVAAAQVHAILALAAATAESVVDNSPNTTVSLAWAKAVS